MRKDIVALFLCSALALSLGLTGCGGSSSEAEPQDEPTTPQVAEPQDVEPQGTTATQTGSYGTYYTHQALVDSQLGVSVFNAFVPDGWQASIQSDWSRVSPMYPGFEMVTIASPDGQVVINIASYAHFTQSAYNKEGIDYSTYTTYLHYMDAGAYTDAYIDNSYGADATLVAELPEDQDTVDALWQCLNQAVASLNEETNDGQLGTPMSIEAYDVSTCRRQYQVPGGYIETTVADYAFNQIIDGYLRQEYLHWYIPYSIVYSTASEEAFEEYYDEYELIVANSCFTPAYFSAESYVSSMRAARAMEAKEAASRFSSSGYESSTADSDSRSVAEQWDDVIREVDTYQTLDGDYVQVSTGNGVVAQDGDTFYVGPSYDVPPGFTELSTK